MKIMKGVIILEKIFDHNPTQEQAAACSCQNDNQPFQNGRVFHFRTAPQFSYNQLKPLSTKAFRRFVILTKLKGIPFGIMVSRKKI